MLDNNNRDSQITDQSPNTTTTRVNAASTKGFALYPIGELLARPEIPPDYLVDNLLVRGTCPA